MPELSTKPAVSQAVIYARVSGKKQVKQGDGLSSQESRCREFAAYKGYNIAQVFTDDVTGKLAERPSMQAMLAFLRKHHKDESIVMIDDITRFARGLEAHLKLRKLLASAGGTLQSPSIEFGYDSDSRLVDHMLSTMAEHQRGKNAEQTKNRMRRRVMNGCWVFQAPIGYRYERTGGHGKLLVPNEPHASILREALEGFASARFETQVEVKHFLESQPDFPKNPLSGEIRNQRVHDYLTRLVYSGV